MNELIFMLNCCSQMDLQEPISLKLPQAVLPLEKSEESAINNISKSLGDN